MEVVMFYFRINRLFIKSNQEAPKILGIIGPDRAEVKLFSFITTGNMDLPDMDEILSTASEKRKKELVKEAVSQVAASRIFTEIKNVRDNHIMTFGDTGYVLYQSESIPDDFNWTFIAIESDRDLKKVGRDIERVVDDDRFDGFCHDMIRLLATAANPAFTLSVGAAKFITDVYAKQLRNEKDDLIGILYMSLNRVEHYPHGERKKDGVGDLTNNMLVDYSIFGFES